MAKGRTLWEMFIEKFSGPVEFKFYNPLRARVGTALMINDIELRDLNFFVQEIREYQRTINDKQFLFADYVLLARPLHGDEVRRRLRLNPVADPERVSGLSHDALLLSLYDEMGYNEDLHKVLKDPSKVFQMREDGELKEEYRRINDVAAPYKAQVSIIRDVDKDGKVRSAEVEKPQVEYWDYWRQIQDEAGQSVTQFLFVEMDTSNGWFQLWRGQTMDPHKVVVM